MNYVTVEWIKSSQPFIITSMEATTNHMFLVIPCVLY